MADDEYEVGYGRPPKATQFKKGQSGNPKGRPKGSNNLSTDVKEILKSKVPITKDGKRGTVSAQQAALLRLREKALNGDVKALGEFLKLAAAHNNDALTSAAEDALGHDDAAVLAGFLARQKPGSDETDEDGRDDEGEAEGDNERATEGKGGDAA